MCNKKYGIYPGKYIDEKEVENYSEIDLYLKIDSINDEIWLTEYFSDESDRLTLMELTYGLEYLIYQTRKYGVDIELPDNNELITLTESYNSWYEYYADHFQGSLTDDEWEMFKELRYTGKDYSAFLPEKKWSELNVKKLSL